MSLETIRKIIEETSERMDRAGIPAKQLQPALMRFEAEALNLYFRQQKAVRDTVRANGTAAMAERWGITQRAARYRREKALNELGNENAA